jgi:site-specific recombinase XerD
MTTIGPTLQAYFSVRLISQRQASPHTIAAYRDCYRLLFAYLGDTTGKQPAKLDLDDIDAEAISGFLTYLEKDRGVSVSTRNARLVALRSWFTFAAQQHPEHAALIARVLAIPSKRCDQPLVRFLEPEEVEALLRAPNADRWAGRRDRVLLEFAVQTGLRVSELTAVRRCDLGLGRGAHVQVLGKGRKERAVPLSSHTVAVLGPWLAERGGDREDPVFPGPRGQRLSRDAVRKLVVKHTHAAAARCGSLSVKTAGVHTLRHTCAMTLLRHHVDLATIALWLGHEDLRTVQIYLHADLAMKEQALARITPPNTEPGRYRPSDPILAFLESL